MKQHVNEFVPSYSCDPNLVYAPGSRRAGPFFHKAHLAEDVAGLELGQYHRTFRMPLDDLHVARPDDVGHLAQVPFTEDDVARRESSLGHMPATSIGAG